MLTEHSILKQGHIPGNGGGHGYGQGHDPFHRGVWSEARPLSQRGMVRGTTLSQMGMVRGTTPFTEGCPGNQFTPDDPLRGARELITKSRPLAVIRKRRLTSVALFDPLRSVQFRGREKDS